MSHSLSKTGGSVVIIQEENDEVEQQGGIFILLGGVMGKEVNKSFAKHWAIGIKLEDGNWIRLEGLRQETQLKSSYSKSGVEPSGLILPPIGAQVMFNSPDVVVPTQLIKCLSIEPIIEIRASPKQLQEIARSIPESEYMLGYNDCQTWLLKAMVKLRRYNLNLEPTEVTLGQRIKRLFEVLVNVSPLI